MEEAKGMSSAMAQNTIDELKLNGERLCRLRGAVLTKINDELRIHVNSGIPLDQAIQKLCRSHLTKQDGKWGTFFTTKRSYLGATSEIYLNSIGYAG